MFHVNAFHRHNGEHSYPFREKHVFMSLDVAHDRNPEKTLGAFEVPETPQACVMGPLLVDNG